LLLTSQSRHILSHLLQRDLKKQKTDVRDLLANHATQQERAEQTRMAQDGIPNQDMLAGLLEERETLRHSLQAATRELAGLEAEQDRLARDIERRQTGLERILDLDAEARLTELDRGRLLLHSARVRTTLNTFRQKVIERHVRRIEQLVLESYQQLLRKTSLVGGLTIDSHTFELTLFAKGGAPVSQDRLSAGERQLLAIALLWGLAKASGRPLPTAIDTPLGRLDHGHRTHLVERYFPHASHQVLLLSTDAEIEQAHLAKLARSVGRSYLLLHDDTTGTSTIEPGYFSRKEAA
jgi:DNA sulfur modification protein DndD